MQVNLRRDWFAPNNLLFAASANPNEIPEEFRNELPSTAEVIGEDPKDRMARKAKADAASKKSLDHQKSVTLAKLEN